MNKSTFYTEAWQSQIENLIEALELPTARLYTKIGKDAREDQITGLIYKNVLDPLWKKIIDKGDSVSKRGERVYFNVEFIGDSLGIEQLVLSEAFKRLQPFLQAASALYALEPDKRQDIDFDSLMLHYPEDTNYWQDEILNNSDYSLKIGTVRREKSDGTFDIKTGIVTIKNGITGKDTKFKLAKFFETCIRNGIIPQSYRQNINQALTGYNTLKSNIGGTVSQKRLIVISRHPIDIAGMSTDRGWSSCMRLPTKDDPEDGNFHKQIKCDVQEGTLIAYLIKENDRNIEKPIGRVLIKPLYTLSKDAVYYAMEDTTYGTVPRQFTDKVKQIMDSVQPRSGIKAGLYSMPRSLYFDEPYRHEDLRIVVTSSILDDIVSRRITDLSSYRFDRTLDLTGVDFRGVANLHEVFPIRVNLQGANLQGAELQKVSFYEANLQGANLRGAKLQGAFFYNAKLQGAKLQGANLQGANLQKAKLQATNLTDVTGLETCKGLDSVEYDENTIWPAGFNIEQYRN